MATLVPGLGRARGLLRYLAAGRVAAIAALLFFLAARQQSSQVDPALALAALFNPMAFKPLPHPILMLTSNSGYAIVGLMGLLFIHGLGRARRIDMLGVLYAAFLTFFALRDFNFDAYFTSFVAVLVSLGIFLLGRVPRSPTRRLADAEEVRKAIYAYFVLITVVNGGLFLGGYGYTVYSGFRFLGIAFHPNALGQMVAIAAIGFLDFAVLPGGDARRRVAALLLVAVDVELVLASGSRGALMVLVAGLVLIGRRVRISVRSAVLLIVVVAVLVGVYATLVQSSPLSVERLFSLNDDRSGAFHDMWEQFLASPVFGSGADIGASENAVLKAMAATGVCGGLIFLVFLGVALRRSVPILLQRGSGAIDARNAMFAHIVALIVLSGLVDGYMVERLSLSGTLVILAGSGIVTRRREPAGNVRAVRAAA